MRRIVLIGSVILTMLCGANLAVAAPAGDAVRDAGGSTLSANAADAVNVTCVGLVTAQDPLTSEQVNLRTNCGNMVRTTLNVVGGNGALPNEYGFSTDEEVYNALRQFNGEEGSSAGRSGTDSSDRQMSVVGSRMAATRQGLRASNSMSFSLDGMQIANVGDSPTAGDVSPPVVGGGAGSADGGSPWGWFGTVDYGFGDRDSTTNENEYDVDSYEVTVGLDYQWDNGLVLGGAIGYNDNEVDFDGDDTAVPGVAGGETTSDGWTFSGFGQYSAESFYVNGIFSYTALEYDTKRRVFFTSSGAGAAPNTQITGDTDGDVYEFEASIGKVFGDGPTRFDLYAGYNYLKLEIDSYTEDPDAQGIELEFDDQDIDSKQSLVGAVLSRSFNAGGAVIVPYLGVEWRHEFDNDARTVNARYAQAFDPTQDGIDFLIPTDDPDEDYAEITLGLSSQLQNSLFLFVQWQAVAGLDDTTANLVTGGIRGVF